MKDKTVNFSRARLWASLITVGAAGVLYLSPGAASELVYQPLNPSFGGSPGYGQVLLESALATRKHKAPDIGSDRFGIEERTPGEQLNDAIERNVLTRLSMAASSSIMDAQGNFIPGVLETQNYTISIEDMGGNILRIVTTDKSTGNITEFQVNQP